MKFLFVPFSIAAGLIAGFLSKKIFDGIWGLFDDQDAPEAQHREISLLKLVLALAIEGAVFRAVRGLVDHSARHGFQRATGSWPGDEAPEPS
jgi:Protein of unknown function (DUF4235)